MERDVKLEPGLESTALGAAVPPVEHQSGRSADKVEAATRSRLPRGGPKKRTKTGCLTCRKRRIKCGEEKPVCSNCIKSKRECQGYARPVIFKHPIVIFGNYDSPVHASGHLHPLSMAAPFHGGYDNIQPQQRPAALHQPILAPRPFGYSGIGQSYSLPPEAMEASQSASMDSFYSSPVQMYGSAQAAPQHLPAVGLTSSPPEQTLGHHVMSNAFSRNEYPPESSSCLRSRDHSTTVDPHQSHFWNFQPSQISASGLPYFPDDPARVSALPVDLPGGLPRMKTIFESSKSRELSYSQVAVKDEPGDNSYYYFQDSCQLPVSACPDLLSPVPTQLTYEDEESDEYFDVESDAEMAVQAEAEDNTQLSLIVASAEHDEYQFRSFTSHLNEPDILATYRPSFGSTPLNNPKTARIFIHFLYSTGPSLSVFERHPPDLSFVPGSRVPTAQQGLWTYTLPLKALEHPSLLQAILAISSLHIAVLQQAPLTISIKHYNYALRRLGKAVGLPTRRKQIGTLAATLLLGYYEVMAAEHSKWNSHVAGSTHLIREIDFANMTRKLRAHRQALRAEREQNFRQSNSSSFDFSYLDGQASDDDPFAEKETAIDENLIGSILGRQVKYDESGSVNDGQPSIPKRNLTRRDIENFRIQCDLYWWYCKQDTINSMIGGNRLFLSYDQWGQCPPRAGVGRLDAIYGSFDHLVLLLGRLADFVARDRRRKIKALQASNGDWKPNPHYFKFIKLFAAGGDNVHPASKFPSDQPGVFNKSGSKPYSAANQTSDPGVQAEAGSASIKVPPSPPSPGNTTNAFRQWRGIKNSPGNSPPTMYGMIPPRGPVQLPPGFLPGVYPSNAAPAVDDESKDYVPYIEAESEWDSILSAFDVFVASLGRDYLPLPADVTPPISTPFGPALQYRTNTIGVLWGFYYAGRILLQRSHPSMPPAMMVAAGVAAATTAEYCQTIGKIAAGIYYPQRYNLEAGHLSPSLGSSLTEMTVPIFFAAVQYTDAAQRGWTITTLNNITRLTGWKTATTIANGCENAWVVAAKKGKGPPYHRTGVGEPSVQEDLQGDRQQDHDKSVGENNERRFKAVSKSRHIRYAWGILSLEDDLLNLDLEDRMR